MNIHSVVPGEGVVPCRRAVLVQCTGCMTLALLLLNILFPMSPVPCSFANLMTCPEFSFSLIISQSSVTPVSHSRILATCYLLHRLEGDRTRQNKDTGGLLPKRLIGHYDQPKPRHGCSRSQSSMVIHPRCCLGLPALILTVTSGSNLLCPVRPCSLLRLWGSPFIATLMCQRGIHPLVLTFYSNLPTLVKFEETEGVHFPYRVANNGLGEPSILRSSLVILQSYWSSGSAVSSSTEAATFLTFSIVSLSPANLCLQSYLPPEGL